jgi:hypothetical protein
MKLEKENFKINSKGWKIVDGFKQNKKGDVWEIIDGEFKGEQLFTWGAAMRETKKAGKRMPTNEEFDGIDLLEYNVPLAGYRYATGAFNSRATHANLWSSSPASSSTAWYRLLNSTNSTVYRDTYSKAFGFSVRCLKNCKDEMHNQNEENRGFCYSCEETIKVKKLSTKYEISNGENSIQVKVKEDGNLTIRTGGGNSQFKFENSNPEMVRKIAELILTATKAENIGSDATIIK